MYVCMCVCLYKIYIFSISALWVLCEHFHAWANQMTSSSGRIPATFINGNSYIDIDICVYTCIYIYVHGLCTDIAIFPCTYALLDKKGNQNVERLQTKPHAIALNCLCKCQSKCFCTWGTWVLQVALQNLHKKKANIVRKCFSASHQDFPK